jgi:hypothetical protein
VRRGRERRKGMEEEYLRDEHCPLTGVMRSGGGGDKEVRPYEIWSRPPLASLPRHRWLLGRSTGTKRQRAAAFCGPPHRPATKGKTRRRLGFRGQEEEEEIEEKMAHE